MINTRSQLRHSTLMKIEGRPKPILSPEYIAGLTDGEGCFYVAVQPPFNKNGGARVQLAFFIKMSEEDKGLLDKVRDTLDGVLRIQKLKSVMNKRLIRRYQRKVARIGLA